MDQNEIPHDPCHLGVPSGASKMISETMIYLAQTVLLSCSYTDTVYKQTKKRFHLTHVTYECHWVRPNQLSGLWYVRRKPCTYLASGLAISKQTESSFHLSLVTKEYHRVRPKHFLAYGTFGANRAPILH